LFGHLVTIAAAHDVEMVSRMLDHVWAPVAVVPAVRGGERTDAHPATSDQLVSTAPA
jgi:hypothetical protein